MGCSGDVFLDACHMQHELPFFSDLGYNCCIPCFEPLLNHNKCQGHLTKARIGLSVPKSSFQMKVKFAFHLEINVPASEKRVGRQNLRYLKFRVKFPLLVMIWGAISSTGVGPLSFIKYNVSISV